MKTREEMIQELIDDDMNGVASMSMGENDNLIRDMLLEGRKGYNNYTDEELQEESIDNVIKNEEIILQQNESLDLAKKKRAYNKKKK